VRERLGLIGRRFVCTVSEGRRKAGQSRAELKRLRVLNLVEAMAAVGCRSDFRMKWRLAESHHKVSAVAIDSNSEKMSGQFPFRNLALSSDIWICLLQLV